MNRNDKCSCGSSKKYKHCCLKLVAVPVSIYGLPKNKMSKDEKIAMFLKSMDGPKTSVKHNRIMKEQPVALGTQREQNITASTQKTA